MSELVLPAGYSYRRPTIEAAEAVFALVNAHELRITGAPDVTLSEVRDWLRDPDLDLQRDAWVVQTADGSVVGAAIAHRVGVNTMVDVDVYTAEGHEAVGPALWQAVFERAEAAVAADGLPEAKINVMVFEQDAERRAFLGDLGFGPATSFRRMGIDFDGPVEEPEVPEGVTVRVGPEEELKRAAYALQQESFARHFGFVPISYEKWLTRRESHETSDLTQLRVAYVDGTPAAVLIGGNEYVEGENRGYVQVVGVHSDFRGRGLAKLLLRQAFALDHARGRKGTYLHVDANNVTPALGVYEGVGMRSVMSIDVWQRTTALPVPA